MSELESPATSAAASAAGEADPWWRLPFGNATGGWLELDRASGLPAAIGLPPTSGRPAVSVSSGIALTLGGGETRALAGGLDYPGADVVTGPLLCARDAVTAPCRSAGERRVAAELDTWSLTFCYLSTQDSPRIRTSLELTRSEDDSRPLRNVELDLALGLGDPVNWLLHAPGNRVRPGTPLSDLGVELAVSSAAGSLGSIGLIALSHRETGVTLVLWPFSRSEVGWITLRTTADGVAVHVVTNLAGDPAPGETIRYSGFHLDVLAEPWQGLRPKVRSWLASLGVRSPEAKPAWTAGAAIYEVQVGQSVFSGGYSYEPYPQLEDVTEDLPRIAALGFDAIQLMPKQPYPSYNVEDYDDTVTTYGGDASLRELVERAHELGVRVVLDVVLHGVVDRRSVRTALRRVEESGVLDQPALPVGDVFADSPESRTALQRAWCQHIVDFAPFWLEGSPEVHPLTTARPEWFCRDSSGELIGIYTEAFDLADEQWQAWFCQVVVGFVERFDVDGFRFDAPTYNNFANWSAKRRHRASASTLGCVALFDRLRCALKERYPDVMMFTEPSGVVLRESVDVNYNYDELWLIPAITHPTGEPSAVASGSDLARWLDERDATLPAGALTAHHIDSHDTFWWPAPGRKWRREQIGPEATRAFMWCLALCGGPYLTFVGGEVGIEEDLRRTFALRRTRPELAGAAAADYQSVAVEDERVFAVVRHAGELATLVLVNLSPAEVIADCRLSGGYEVVLLENYYTGTALQAAPDGTLRAELGPFGIALVELGRI
jgi:glycosidase